MDVEVQPKVSRAVSHLPHVAACQNCYTVLDNGYRYCPTCGQQALDKRQRLKDLFLNWWDDEIGVDGRLLRTFVLLLTRPGEVARRYAAGQRRSYTDPIRLYFSLVVVYVLVVRNSMSIVQPQFEQMRRDAAKIGKPMTEFVEAYLYLFTQQFDLVLLFSVPALAWLLWLSFRRTEPWFANHLTGTFYLYSATIILSVGLVPIRFLVGTSAEAGITLLSTTGYAVWHIKNAYQKDWAERIGRTVLIYAVSIVLLVVGVLLAATAITIWRLKMG